MRVLVFLAITLSLGYGGVLPHTKFEEEIASTLDVDEFKKDMQILNTRPVQSAASKEELEQLLKNIDPISATMSASEQREEALNAEHKDDLFEGDILLSNAQLAEMMNTDGDLSKRQASTAVTIWGTAPIPYFFDRSIPDKTKNLVRAAAVFWNANTCVNFQENGGGKDSITIVQEGGCWSTLGKNGGKQKLSLATGGCDNFSTVSHEMEHALGVHHEQVRTDREKYVRVNEANIYSGLSNFQLEPKSSTFGLPYDFGSNMHYTQDSFAKDYSKPTIVAVGKYAEYQDGMRGHMPSFLDVLKVNKYYNCDKNCTRKANPCKNGGYLDVKTCSKCICPEGLGGEDCSGNPTGKCDEELTATTSSTTKTISVGNYYSQEKIAFDSCAYVIKAPVGYKVEVTVVKVQGYGITGCKNNGIEIKTKKDMTRRGFRFCETPRSTKRYLSESNKAVVLAYNNQGLFTADISYRYY